MSFPRRRDNLITYSKRINNEKNPFLGYCHFHPHLRRLWRQQFHLYRAARTLRSRRLDTLFSRMGHALQRLPRQRSFQAPGPQSQCQLHEFTYQYQVHRRKQERNRGSERQRTFSRLGSRQQENSRYRMGRRLGLPSQGTQER